MVFFLIACLVFVHYLRVFGRGDGDFGLSVLLCTLPATQV